MTRTPLILASGSKHRAALLRSAQVSFEQHASEVNEEELKKDRDIKTLAMFLAKEKARAISAIRPDALVLGADQVLLCQERAFDKPRTMVEAKEHLNRLRGRTHTLETALCVMRNKQEIWSHLETPKLTMRQFSDAFLDHYCQSAGEEILTSVGGYQIEGFGVQLFEAIEGDTFSIQGLPLIPLLKFLQEQGLVVS